MSDEKEDQMEDLKHGRPMTEEELEDYYKAFQLVEDSIEGLEEEDVE